MFVVDLNYKHKDLVFLTRSFCNVKPRVRRVVLHYKKNGEASAPPLILYFFITHRGQRP